VGDPRRPAEKGKIEIEILLREDWWRRVIHAAKNNFFVGCSSNHSNLTARC
jgi:hypothetical protein